MASLVFYKAEKIIHTTLVSYCVDYLGRIIMVFAKINNNIHVQMVLFILISNIFVFSFNIS